MDGNKMVNNKSRAKSKPKSRTRTNKRCLYVLITYKNGVQQSINKSTDPNYIKRQVK